MQEQMKIIYNMRYAIQMKNKGHVVLMTMPNPNNEKLNCWVFMYDDTFDSDFAEVKAEWRKKNG